jgi:hypothetical protein
LFIYLESTTLDGSLACRSVSHPSELSGLPAFLTTLFGEQATGQEIVKP